MEEKTDHLVLPGRLLHEEMEDSEAQRLRGSTGLLGLLESSSPFSSSTSRKPLDRPERSRKTIGGKNIYNRSQKYILRILVAKADAILDQSCSMNVQSFKF